METPTQTVSLEQRITRLSTHLRLARQYERAAILLVVFHSEFMRAKAEQLLVNELTKAHESIVRIHLETNPQHPTTDLPKYLYQHPQSGQAIFFIYDLSHGGSSALQYLNYRRELLIEGQERLILWLNETEFATLAREAPDFFAFRGHTTEFLERPTSAELQALSAKFAQHDGWREFSNRSEVQAGIALRQRLLAELPDEPQFALQRADLQNSLGELLLDAMEYEEALPLLEAALQTRQEILGEAHLDVAHTLNNIGYWWRSKGEYEKAREYYEKALALRQEMVGKIHPETAQSLNNLGTLLELMGRPDEAERYLEQALQIRRQVLGDMHPDTASSLHNLGSLLAGLAEYDAARHYYEEALAITQQVLGAAHPETAQTLNNLALVCYYQHDLPTAVSLMQQAFLIREKTLGPRHAATKNSRQSLTFIQQKLAQQTE